MSVTMTIEVPVQFRPEGRYGCRGLCPQSDKPSLPRVVCYGWRA